MQEKASVAYLPGVSEVVDVVQDQVCFAGFRTPAVTSPGLGSPFNAGERYVRGTSITPTTRPSAHES